jgi:hypothetical protein
MPTELPSDKRSARIVATAKAGLLDRTMNWTAFLVGIGLCFWVVKGMNLPF